MEWSNMLPEVLDIIAQKHITFYEDYHSFAGVCKSWHSAALYSASKHQYANGPPSRLPSLMLVQESKDKEFRKFFLVSNKSIRKIRLPQVQGKFCMSSSEWVLTVGKDHVAQLINPLSSETINLPTVDTLTQDVDMEWDMGWHRDIEKLLLLTNNNPSSSALPLVAVIWGIFSMLGICRPGDNKWLHVQYSEVIYDVTYYNRRVYTLDMSCNIEACDVYGEDPLVLVNVAKLPARLYDSKQLGALYIIGLDDDERKTLLVVIREGLYAEIGDEILGKTYQTKRFLVFRYDLEDGRWSAVNDLGKKTLFVGFNSSFWIEDTTGVIKSNSIYYTDDVSFYQGSNGGDMGIYSLSDKTIEPHFTEPHFTGESRQEHGLARPIWIQ